MREQLVRDEEMQQFAREVIRQERMADELNRQRDQQEVAYHMLQVECQASQVVSDASDTAQMYARHEILADRAYIEERVASIHIEFAQRAQLRVQEVQSAYHNEAEDAIRQI